MGSLRFRFSKLDFPPALPHFYGITVIPHAIPLRLYSVIFEIREDAEGEFYHLVTLWKATPAERRLYEENAS